MVVFKIRDVSKKYTYFFYFYQKYLGVFLVIWNGAVRIKRDARPQKLKERNIGI